MKCTIWDIDNCLADDQWRQPLVDWSKCGDERYDSYNRVMQGDRPRHLREFRVFTKLGATPVFFTGRPEKWRYQTSAWLTRYCEIEKPIIYMRPDNSVNLRPVDLKERMLRNLFVWCPATAILGAFDDLPVVIDMYKGYGIPAAVLAVCTDLGGVYEPADLQRSLQ